MLLTFVPCHVIVYKIGCSDGKYVYSIGSIGSPTDLMLIEFVI